MPPKKTQMSRFNIHDDLTAPEASIPILKGLQSSAGQLPNFLGVLAESSAALRGYVRFRAELTRGTLPQATRERIALAVAEHHHSKPGIAQHNRTARRAGLGLDEVAKAKEFDSANPQEAAMLRYLQPLVEQHGEHPTHLHEEAR
jgi:AhpD family alkylhydroperoxidase